MPYCSKGAVIPVTTQTALDLVVERCCYLALRGCDCPTTGARLLPWQTSAQALARGAGDIFSVLYLRFRQGGRGSGVGGG